MNMLQKFKLHTQRSQELKQVIEAGT